MTRKRWLTLTDKNKKKSYYYFNEDGDLIQNRWFSITNLVGPIIIRKLQKIKGASADLPNTMECPVLAQVIAFDVIYDREAAKEELRYLFKVIDLFEMTDEEKNDFLEAILQYWILSVKDAAWGPDGRNERERRYVAFLYDDYEYKEIEMDDQFLKVKTSLFLTPDFIMGNNPVKGIINNELKHKRLALFNGEYLFCSNCLNQDFDSASMEKMPDKCPICGSRDVKMIME